MSKPTEEQGIVVPVSQNQVSALEDSLFENVRSKVQQWLSQPRRPSGKEMDNVFFNEDKFQLMIDARGYQPEDVKCTVTCSSVEVIAERQEIQLGVQRSMSTTRSYHLPQRVLAQEALCCLSFEGILLLVVPWQK